MLGTLIWQKGDVLRFSLDRADLLDLRLVEHFKTSDFRYKWVYDHWENNDYKIVHDRLGNLQAQIGDGDGAAKTLRMERCFL